MQVFSNILHPQIELNNYLKMQGKVAKVSRNS